LPSIIAWEDDQSIEAMEDTSVSYFTYPAFQQAGEDGQATGIVDFKNVLSASLRTRYKYAEYLIWRPYIFRALHSPGDLSDHDYECCSKALKVS